MGRKSTEYNPTRCSAITTNCGESTWGYVSYAYDGLSRLTTTTEQDGGTITANYSNFPCVTAADETGRSHESCTDGLGRLTSVVEDPSGLAYPTSYTYDALDNLTGVNQSGSRQRSFVYDSLSRLTSATNPESGTETYSYDANGNLIYKTTPTQNQQGSSTVTLTYCYDALNHVTAKAYTQQTCSGNTLPSPVATYAYGQSNSNCLGATSCSNIGRRTSMTDQAGSEAWAFDQMGRAIVDQRTTNTVSKTISYTYNLDGSMATQTIPGASDGTHPDVQTFTQGDAGRTTWFYDDSWNIAGGLNYTPAGQVCYRWGGWGSTYYTSMTYNSRLQLATIGGAGMGSSDPNHAAPAPCSVVNTYYDDGYSENTINLSYSYLDSSSHNNGNVMSMANGLDNNIGQFFSYDSLNRLSSAQTASTYSTSPSNCWGENYSYDAWGNLLKIAQTAGSYTGCTSESGFDFTGEITSQNQISSAAGYNYDAAGNLMQITGSGGATYTYDAENHLTSTGGVTYTYDGDGKRVMKSSGEIYWYGLNSTPLMETDFSNNMYYVYMYLNGERLARRNWGNEIDWYDNDALGSARFLGGLNVTYYSDYYPFGGERAIHEDGWNQPCPFGCNPVPSNYLFTGKERDSESNLDNFGARYNSSQMGRFMSPDPVEITTERLQNPQQLNLYAYVANNPLRFIDPTGEILQCADDADQQKQCFADLQQIAGDAASRLSMNAKTGVISFDTKDLDLSKNEGAALVNDLVGSKNTYDFSVGPTVETANGPQKVDFITNLPTFGDQPQIGQPKAGVSDVVALFLNNPNITQVSNTNLKVALDYTVAFHELAEAFAKIDGGKGGSYEQGHNAALQREMILRDQRPYLKQYNTGAGGPANSPNPQGGIIIKR